jgi:hypothetical protein
MSDAISNYITLQKEIHDALRLQHPEWVSSDGSSPICDSYEVRFAELLRLFTRRVNRSEASRREPLSRSTQSRPI